MYSRAVEGRGKKKAINKPVLVAALAMHVTVATLTWRDISKRPADRILWDEDSVAHRKCCQHARIGGILADRPPTRIVGGTMQE